MKRIICRIFSIIGIASVCVPCLFSQIVVKKGNGNIITTEKIVSEFDKIKCKGAAEIRYHLSDKYKVAVRRITKMY